VLIVHMATPAFKGLRASSDDGASEGWKSHAQPHALGDSVLCTVMLTVRFRNGRSAPSRSRCSCSPLRPSRLDYVQVL
jgi:hypothetical protein